MSFQVFIIIVQCSRYILNNEKCWNLFNLCPENVNHLESESLKALCYLEIKLVLYAQLQFVVLLLFLNRLLFIV